MITSINHFSFTVSDLERSISFYRDFLGLELISDCERDEEFSTRVTGIKGAKLDIAYIRASNCCIELIEYPAEISKKIDTSTCNVGSSHICFNVDDFDSWIEKINANEYRICGEVCLVPAGPNKGKQVVYFEDPDGNTIEFISNDIKK